MPDPKNDPFLSFLTHFWIRLGSKMTGSWSGSGFPRLRPHPGGGHLLPQVINLSGPPDFSPPGGPPTLIRPRWGPGQGPKMIGFKDRSIFDHF